MGEKEAEQQQEWNEVEVGVEAAAGTVAGKGAGTGAGGAAGEGVAAAVGDAVGDGVAVVARQCCGGGAGGDVCGAKRENVTALWQQQHTNGSQEQAGTASRRLLM